MRTTRRALLTAGAGTTGLILLEQLTGPLLNAQPAPHARLQRLGRMAPSHATAYDPYVTTAAAGNHATWVQVELAQPAVLQQAILYPAFDSLSPLPQGYGFPVRLRVEGSLDPRFTAPIVLADLTTAALDNPDDQIVGVSLVPARVRFVRLVATELRPHKDGYSFALAKVSLLSQGQDLAEGRPVEVDEGDRKLAQHLTRPARPMGEGITTDNPQNVLPDAAWRRVPTHAAVPLTGVALGHGVFEAAMRHNVDYLLSSFSVDEMLRPFLLRAGKPVRNNLRKPIEFWDTELPGSSAGRFLMGAGNTLRWMQDAELQQAMEAVLAGIADCREPDGYIMAYPRETILRSERGGYTRSWVTHGLLEAGYAGHSEAMTLLRGYYDWFDQCEYLPQLLRGGAQGVQGMVASTRVSLSPVGKPADAQVVQRFYQENYWLDGLAKQNPDLIWQYPYDRPHNYLITDIEAYLDLYMATGDSRYLQAVLGAWQLYHDHWEHVGGSIAITEFGEFPPDSYRLLAQAPFDETGELCGSAFWIKLNQRLHTLYPEQEKYTAEIEKSIYNIALANQVRSAGFNYHARLVGRKGDQAVPVCTNSCCEGQGTRIIGSLPEYIYSLAADGVYVNLFESSTVQWTQHGKPVSMRMTTAFPQNGRTEIVCEVSEPAEFTVFLRIPSWADGVVPVEVGGAQLAGTPGTYLALHRTWQLGDTLRFDLPMRWRLTRYTGKDQIAGRQRYALEYGPILMAAIAEDVPVIPLSPAELTQRLRPADTPLHYTLDGVPDVRYMPYWQVQDEQFTCFPALHTA